MIQVNASKRLAVMAAQEVDHEEARSYLEEVSGLTIKGKEVLGYDDVSCFIIKAKDAEKAIARLTAQFKKPKTVHKTKPDADIWTWKTPEGQVEVKVSVPANGKTMAFIKLTP